MKLIDFKNIYVPRGAIFRLPAIWPYEEFVDFMVFETQDNVCPYGLIVSSGYKAGLILVKLPIESISDEGHGLSVKWVISNWEKWIYPECKVENVYVLDTYIATAIE